MGIVGLWRQPGQAGVSVLHHNWGHNARLSICRCGAARHVLDLSWLLRFTEHPDSVAHGVGLLKLILHAPPRDVSLPPDGAASPVDATDKAEDVHEPANRRAEGAGEETEDEEG